MAVNRVSPDSLLQRALDKPIEPAEKRYVGEPNVWDKAQNFAKKGVNNYNTWSHNIAADLYNTINGTHVPHKKYDE